MDCKEAVGRIHDGPVPGRQFGHEGQREIAEADGPQQRVQIPYSPYFIKQVQAGNVTEIRSKGTAIQGTFKKAESYQKSKKTTAFKTEIPAFADTNAATARVLARNGFEVVVPETQTCCGALHAHAGERTEARVLARRNIASLEALDVDAFIVNAAGCGAAL